MVLSSSSSVALLKIEHGTLFFQLLTVACFSILCINYTLTPLAIIY